MKFLLPACVLFLSFCGRAPHQQAKPIHQPNPKAVELERKAILLTMANNRPEKLDSAIVLLRQAVTIDPLYDLGYSQLGTTYWRRKQYDEALHAIKKFTELEPTNPEGLSYYGMLLEARNRNKEAFQYYQKAATLNEEKLKRTDTSDKKYMAIQLNYAFNLKLLNREEEAQKILSAVLANRPDYSPAQMLKNNSRAALIAKITR